MPTPRRLRLWLGIVALVGFWIFATEPWGLSVFELFVFVAPGALMGLAASWIAAALTPQRWHWRDGLNGATIGATVLPPIFAFLVALAGTRRPQHTLEALVLLAWLALGAGAVVALAGYAWRATGGRDRLRAHPRRWRRASLTRTSVGAAAATHGTRAPFGGRDPDREEP